MRLNQKQVVSRAPAASEARNAAPASTASVAGGATVPESRRRPKSPLRLRLEALEPGREIAISYANMKTPFSVLIALNGSSWASTLYLMRPSLANSRFGLGQEPIAPTASVKGSLRLKCPWLNQRAWLRRLDFRRLCNRCFELHVCQMECRTVGFPFNPPAQNAKQGSPSRRRTSGSFPLRPAASRTNPIR